MTQPDNAADKLPSLLNEAIRCLEDARSGFIPGSQPDEEWDARRDRIVAQLQVSALVSLDSALEVVGRAIMDLPPALRTADPGDGIQKMRAALESIAALPSGSQGAYSKFARAKSLAEEVLGRQAAS